MDYYDIILHEVLMRDGKISFVAESEDLPLEYSESGRTEEEAWDKICANLKIWRDDNLITIRKIPKFEFYRLEEVNLEEETYQYA